MVLKKVKTSSAGLKKKSSLELKKKNYEMLQPKKTLEELKKKKSSEILKKKKSSEELKKNNCKGLKKKIQDPLDLSDVLDEEEKNPFAFRSSLTPLRKTSSDKFEKLFASIKPAVDTLPDVDDIMSFGSDDDMKCKKMPLGTMKNDNVGLIDVQKNFCNILSKPFDQPTVGNDMKKMDKMIECQRMAILNESTCLLQYYNWRGVTVIKKSPDYSLISEDMENRLMKLEEHFRKRTDKLNIKIMSFYKYVQEKSKELSWISDGITLTSYLLQHYPFMLIELNKFEIRNKFLNRFFAYTIRLPHFVTKEFRSDKNTFLFQLLKREIHFTSMTSEMFVKVFTNIFISHFLYFHDNDNVISFNEFINVIRQFARWDSEEFEKNSEKELNYFTKSFQEHFLRFEYIIPVLVDEVQRLDNLYLPMEAVRFFGKITKEFEDIPKLFSIFHNVHQNLLFNIILFYMRDPRTFQTDTMDFIIRKPNTVLYKLIYLIKKEIKSLNSLRESGSKGNTIIPRVHLTLPFIYSVQILLQHSDPASKQTANLAKISKAFLNLFNIVGLTPLANYSILIANGLIPRIPLM
ncbi:hypothetical protein SNEBB_005279 [Seison nebaliae]|nr:hypothetical protein SNEBB_005279 [Seison nebaliae]